MKIKKYTFKRFILGIILTVLVTISLIIANTVIIFLVSFKSENRHSEVNPEVNINMSSAKTINDVYLSHLVKVFGVKSPALKPLFSLRDHFYNRGLSYLSDNDAEKNMWWYYVIYFRFKDNYSKLIEYDKNPNNNIFYKHYMDEIYTNIEKMGTLPIKSKGPRKLRYISFIMLSTRYTENIIKLYKKTDKNLESLYLNKEEMDKIENLYTLLKKLKKKAKKSEKESLDFFSKTPVWYKEIFLVNIITQIITESYIKKQTLDCGNFYTKLNINTYDKLKTFLKYPKKFPVTKHNKKLIELRLIENEKLIDKIKNNKCTIYIRGQRI